jgi:hypothetical protein
MLAKNFEDNLKYFNNLKERLSMTGAVKGEERGVLPTQLRVGDLVTFNYTKTAGEERLGFEGVRVWDYTVVVANTTRAPAGVYTTANTRNRLMTAFTLDALPINEQVQLLERIYSSKTLLRQKLTKYTPEEHLTYKTRLRRFWVNLFEKFNLRVKSRMKMDSRNFRTFMVANMRKCRKVM